MTTVLDTGPSLLASAAKMYASHGIAVFPVRPHGKLPLFPRCKRIVAQHKPADCGDGTDVGHGFHDATSDIDTVQRWWAENPEANIGIALGASGVFALDVDGPQGRADLEELEATYGTLPPTYQVITGRPEGDGRHYLFHQPEGQEIRNGKITTKLEVRGAGGYVIASPSSHESGNPYRAVGKWQDIVEAPAWLLDAIAKPAPVSPNGSLSPTPWSADNGDLAVRRLRGLCGNLAMMMPDTGRNNSLNHAAYVAGTLVGAGRLDRELAEGMLVEAARRCGLEADDGPGSVAATIASGIESGMGSPDHSVPQEAAPALVNAPAAAGLLPPASGSPGAPEGAQEDAGQAWAESIREQARSGADFLAGSSGPIPAIWGVEGSDEILWAKGEGLLVAGPAGVGKTTVVQQVVAGRLGHPRFSSVLGHPVAAESKGVLYLALDRPRQIGRALGRILSPQHESVRRLVVWDRELPFDPATQRAGLIAMCTALDVDTVVIDSLYDLSPSIVKPEVAGEVVRTLKVCVNAGVDVVAIHHPRKNPAGQKAAAPHLDDLYGGMQLGAGFGSVLYVRGDAGDTLVTLLHLKQPGAVVGPISISHDHAEGVSSVANVVDLVAIATLRGSITVQDAASAMSESDSPTRNQKDRAKRKLDGLVKSGHLQVVRGGGKTGQPAVYGPGGVQLVPAPSVPADGSTDVVEDERLFDSEGE